MAEKKTTKKPAQYPKSVPTVSTRIYVDKDSYWEVGPADENEDDCNNGDARVEAPCGNVTCIGKTEYLELRKALDAFFQL